MSLFSQYLLERTDRQILETEYGFATYAFTDSKTVYIEDIFVLPEHRKSGLGSELANKIAELAKKQGYTKMIGTIVPSTKTSTDSIKTLLAYGMRLQSSQNNFIVMEKDL